MQQNVIEKNVYHSIRAIESLHQEIAYITCLPGFPIDNAIATTVKDPDNSTFTCKFFLKDLHGHTFNQKADNFGINNEIILKNSEGDYLIKAKSASKVTVLLGSPQVITVTIKNLQTAPDDDFNNQRLRLIVPIPFAKIDIDLFKCKPCKIEGTTTYAGLIEILIQDANFHLYTYEQPNTDKAFLFVDALELHSLSHFKRLSRTILIAFGFITGNLFQNEYYYQVVNDKENLSLIDDTAFEQQEKSIITNSALFDPMHFHDYLEHFGKLDLLKTITLDLQPQIFTNLCNALFNNETLSRCLLLILEGSHSRFLLLRAAIYSIAIETITNIIYEDNKDKMNPITDQLLADKIQSKMLGVIEEYEAFLPETAKKILEAKVADINKPTNAAKLSKPFELLGIKLSKDDIKILNHRNKFLHGTSPFKEDELESRQVEISYIGRRLLFMVNCLVLKYVGYRGHVINPAAWQQLNFEKEVTDHLYRVI